MNKVFPLTDWSLEAMRPSLTTIIRRLDKLFSKLHKSVKLYQAVEWKAAGGLLNAIYITLWKHPYIVNVPNLKSLIGTCQCLVVGEDSLTSLTDHHGPSGRRPELPPQNFCSVVFKLVALQVRKKYLIFLAKQRAMEIEVLTSRNGIKGVPKTPKGPNSKRVPTACSFYCKIGPKKSNKGTKN